MKPLSQGSVPLLVHLCVMKTGLLFSFFVGRDLIKSRRSTPPQLGDFRYKALQVNLFKKKINKLIYIYVFLFKYSYM